MSCQQRVLLFEGIGFAGLILFLWISEWLDLPHLLAGVPQTPFNYVECLLETLVILVLSGIILTLTHCMLRKISELEGFLPMCSVCKKIRIQEGDDMDENNWVVPEEFFAQKTKVDITHGICPNCAHKLYPDTMARINNKKQADS